MKKSLLSLLLFLGSIIVAQADELIVCGVTVDLTKSGEVKGSGISGQVYYDVSQRMLRLTNATLNAENIGIAADVSPGNMDFRVYLTGKNVINSGRVSVRADNNILFCGNGDLELNGPGNFINKCRMTVYACRVTVNSTANDAFHSMDNGKADLVLSYHGALQATCNGTVLKNFNDITYNTGKLLSGSPTGKEMTIGDDYKLEIGGIKVTPFNRDDVSGSNIQGKVSVSFLNNYTRVIVNLDNATINSGSYGIDFFDVNKEITFVLNGNNTLKATSRGLTGVTGTNCSAINIEGNGFDKLTITAPTGISHQGDINVKDCALDISSSSYGINLWNYGKLTVDNATLHAKAANSSGVAIGKLTGVEYLNGCTETEPLQASYDQRNNSISMDASDPNEMLREVTIEPTYGVIVCGHILKKSMGTKLFRITDDYITGNVLFDPDQNCLILADGAHVGVSEKYKYNPATIEVLDFNSTVYSEAKPFIIYSDGNSTNKISDNVKGSGSAIFSNNDIVITGNAPLDVYSYFGINFFGNHYLHINLKADFSDDAINSAVSSVSSPDDYVILGLSPEVDATYTYRFKGEIKPTFTQLALIDKPFDFTIITPFNAKFDEDKKEIMADGKPVINEWVTFGYPKLAEGYSYVADIAPFIKNHRIYPFLNINFSPWCLQFPDIWNNERHDIYHIYRTKEDAVKNAYSHELNWNGEISLGLVLALHGNIDGEIDTTIDWWRQGYKWEFELVDYNGTNDSQHAWLDGNVLKACYITSDGKRDPNYQSRRSIGCEPLLKVKMLNLFGDLVTGGYIKFRIGDVHEDVEVKLSLSEAEQVPSEKGTEYRFNFNELEEKVLDAIHDMGISKAEFEANYCFTLDSSSPYEYFETPFSDYFSPGTDMVLEPIMRYVKFEGKWIRVLIQSMLTNIKDPDRLGSFQMPISDDNSYLGWTFNDTQREKMGYEKVAVRLYDPNLVFPDVYLVFSPKESPKGDSNLDGTVDVADVAFVIDAMAQGIYDSDCDVNGDGVVDVADIAAIIDIMAGGN